jgi:hypothetical protein
VCDAFIEAFAGDIEEFAALSRAAIDGQFADALTRAVSEAAMRLQDEALSEEPLIVVPEAPMMIARYLPAFAVDASARSPNRPDPNSPSRRARPQIAS